MTSRKTYAEELASLLNAEFPEWRLAAAPDRPELEQRRCFWFQVPCPSAAVATPLSVTVTERDVTIEFLGAHSRCASPHQAVAQIRELVEESSVVDTWYSGPYPRGCAFVKASCSLAAPFGARGVTRIVRRSWRGTRDTNANVG